MTLFAAQTDRAAALEQRVESAEAELQMQLEEVQVQADTLVKRLQVKPCRWMMLCCTLSSVSSSPKHTE